MTAEESLAAIRRKRYRTFAVLYCRNRIEKHMNEDDSIVEAARATWPRSGKQTHRHRPYKNAYVKNLGLDALESEEVRGFIHAVFADGGMEFQDAIKQHIDHIKGDTTHEVVGKDGEVVALKDSPSLAALVKYEDLVLPPKKTTIEQRSVTYNVGGKTPNVRAREVKTIKEITGGQDEP